MKYINARHGLLLLVFVLCLAIGLSSVAGCGDGDDTHNPETPTTLNSIITSVSSLGIPAVLNNGEIPSGSSPAPNVNADGSYVAGNIVSMEIEIEANTTAILVGVDGVSGFYRLLVPALNSSIGKSSRLTANTLVIDIFPNAETGSDGLTVLVVLEAEGVASAATQHYLQAVADGGGEASTLTMFVNGVDLGLATSARITSHCTDCSSISGSWITAEPLTIGFIDIEAGDLSVGQYDAKTVGSLFVVNINGQGGYYCTFGTPGASGQIDITTSNSSRLIGTFYGTASSCDESGADPIVITNGSFNIDLLAEDD